MLPLMLSYPPAALQPGAHLISAASAVAVPMER